MSFIKNYKAVLIRICAVTACLACITARSQNVGIGINDPVNKLHIGGSIVATTPSVSTNAAPTPAQVKTMVNNTTTTFALDDSTGRIYDPGGAAGNYLANMTANANIAAGNVIGIRVILETIQLGTGDSLIIRENSSSTSPIFLAVGNNYTTTGSWVINGKSIYIIFKSNGDASTGTGFSLLFKRLYDNNISQPDIGGFTGSAFLFDTKKGILRGGFLNNSTMGDYSVAGGYDNTASGLYSMAFGNRATASGEYGVALGNITLATGSASTAFGYLTEASGPNATAIGQGTRAVGSNSASLGFNTFAMGDNAIAAGFNNYANGFSSLVIGANNDSIIARQSSLTNTTPLFIIGNGTSGNSRSNAMVVRADGKIGIGVNEPTAMLDVRSTTGSGIQLVSSVNATISLDASDNYDANIYFGRNNSSNWIVGNDGSNDNFYIFEQGGAQRLVVRNSSGNVGIGNNLTSPVVKLHVAGGTDADYPINSGFVCIGYTDEINMVLDNNEILARNNGTASDLFLQASGGQVGIGLSSSTHILQIAGVGRSTSSAWATSSDARVKTNIQSLQNSSLAKILQLRPVTFEWQKTYETFNRGLKQYNTGFISQEFEQVFPSMVETVKEKIGDKTIPDFRLLNLSELPVHLVKAIQELNANYEQMRSDNLALKKELDEIKKLLLTTKKD